MCRRETPTTQWADTSRFCQPHRCVGAFVYSDLLCICCGMDCVFCVYCLVIVVVLDYCVLVCIVLCTLALFVTIFHTSALALHASSTFVLHTHVHARRVCLHRTQHVYQPPIIHLRRLIHQADQMRIHRVAHPVCPS